MKKICCGIVLLLVSLVSAMAQDSSRQYAARLIPDSLLLHAHAVIRDASLQFRLEGLDHSTWTTKLVITVLDSEGDNYAGIMATYSPARNEIREIKATLYDAEGSVLRKLKATDLEDHSYSGEDALVDDTRYKSYQFNHTQYPYTVAYEIHSRYYSSYYFPDWMPQPDESVAVEHSSFTMQLPAEYPLRYRTVSIAGPKESSPEKNMRQYEWRLDQCSAKLHEVFATSWKDHGVRVLTAPGEFALQRYKGSLNSWKEMGKFYYKLNAGRDVLPPDITAKVHALTDTAKTTEGKIAVLYRYLQQNTRYVNISLGIGGLQPYDAQYVAERGYGDCKALSNYMHSLLKAAGIPSSYVLVSGGKTAQDLLTDFPSHQFDHVILMVPHDRDTTWLECTSQNLYPGYLSAFTADRFGLAVTEKGGILVHTPVYNEDDNQEDRQMQIDVDEKGDAYMILNTRYSGEHEDKWNNLIHRVTSEELLGGVHSFFDLRSFKILDYHGAEQLGLIPVYADYLKLWCDNYAQVAGKRILVRVNAVNILPERQRPIKNIQRVSDIHFDMTYHDRITTVISLPDGYKPESIPKPVELHSIFGDYRSECVLKDNKIFYTRDYLRHGTKFPAEVYGQAIVFFDAIYKADHARAVFVKE